MWNGSKLWLVCINAVLAAHASAAVSAGITALSAAHGTYLVFWVRLGVLTRVANTYAMSAKVSSQTRV